MLARCTWSLCMLFVLSPCLMAATYYVRTDGGTAAQCTGRGDAAYPGSGIGRDCAWSHPFWALNPASSPPSWRIQGGDTLVIASGSYRMGHGAPNTAWCDSHFPWDCVLPPLPSGPDQAHPTRIVGRGWNSGCPSPPELWGTERASQVLSLNGSSNIEVACLELTDHSACVESHRRPQAACNRSTYPFGPWAAYGLYAADSSNVLLRDLNIHGLAHTGIHAGRLSNWRVENVRVAGNGWVGWDGEISGGSSNSGNLVFKNFTVEWNGCGETYPGQEPHSCWGQTAGGYGDGLGTAATGGHWTFEDSVFRHNTSDGLDLLYLGRGSAPSSVTVRRTQSYGNAGDQMKVAGQARIENSLLISECGFFADKPFTYHVDHCRSGGSALALDLYPGQHSSVVNTTLAGQGDCLVIAACAEGENCNGSERITFLNSILQGYQEFHDPTDRACGMWIDQDTTPAGVQLNLDSNVVFDVKAGTWPQPGPRDIFTDPLLQNAALSSFDAHLKPGSPALDSGLPPGTQGLIPSNDIEANPRPMGRGTDRGCYEQGGAVLPQGMLLLLLSDSVPGAPTLISPANGSKFSGTSVTFRWNAVPGATNYYFIGTRKIGSFITYWQSEIANATSDILNGFPDDGTECTWQVKAGNSEGWGNWSSTWTFTNGD